MHPTLWNRSAETYISKSHPFCDAIKRAERSRQVTLKTLNQIMCLIRPPWSCLFKSLSHQVEGTPMYRNKRLSMFAGGCKRTTKSAFYERSLLEEAELKIGIIWDSRTSTYSKSSLTSCLTGWPVFWVMTAIYCNSCRHRSSARDETKLLPTRNYKVDHFSFKTRLFISTVSTFGGNHSS